MNPTRRIILMIILGLAAVFSAEAQQSLMQIAQEAEQRAQELMAQENSRYTDILDSRDLEKYESFIADYPNSIHTQEIAKRADEVRRWNSAKQADSIPAYKDYLNTTEFHWFDAEANNCIREHGKELERDSWNSVCSVGTLDAYESYLAQNPETAYMDECREAINRLRGDQRWETVKRSESVRDLQAFIDEYPHSSRVAVAKVRIHELKGLQFFNEGKMDDAYSEFSELQRSDLTPSSKRIFDRCMEYHDYSELGSSETSLRTFMSRYPNGRYYNAVSGKLAKLKAKELGPYSNESDYNEVLGYARDAQTRQVVEQYISANKREQKARRKAEKAYKRRRNGGTFNLGFEFTDFGSLIDDFSMSYYNFGLMLRIGNYSDRVQFAVGVKPGMQIMDWDDLEFHMPVVAQLKLNLFRVAYSNFFIFGMGQYNVVYDDAEELDAAWAAGLGFAWKHFDLSLYYKREIGQYNDDGYYYYDYNGNYRWEYCDYGPESYVGLSMIYYWQL